MADSLFDSDPEGAQRLVNEARATTSAALGDLRSVVRGIHPPVLADRGLAGAIGSLALDMTIPVDGRAAQLDGRPPEPVESAVYFAVAECLANIVKHAAAQHGWISLAHEDGVLRATVGDDGRGGADPDSGTGMLGVMRRLAAFDGTMRLSSPVGGPTVVTLEVPCALSSPKTTPSSGPGLIQLLEGNGFSIVHAVDNASDLATALRDPEAEAAVVDVRLPPTQTDEGLTAAIAVRTERPGFPVMVLSQYVEHLYARELLASGEGAVGYLLKDRVADVAEFVDGVRRVAAGGTVLDPEVVASIMARRRDEPVDRLTPREREVLALMAEGRSNAAIAASLVVSEKAVAKHINSIFAKLDLPVGEDDHRRVRAVLTWLRV